MDVRKIWDDWAWLLAALFVMLVAARLFFGREPFCSSADDEHCLREWISAGGTILAALVALPALLCLTMQTVAAERHHREAIRNSRRENEALARSIRADVAVLRRLASAIDKKIIAHQRSNPVLAAAEISRMCKEIEVLLSGQVLSAMEMRINPVTEPHRLTVLRMVTATRLTIDKMRKNEDAGLIARQAPQMADVKKWADRVIEGVSGFAAGADKVVDSYLRRIHR